MALVENFLIDRPQWKTEDHRPQTMKTRERNAPTISFRGIPKRSMLISTLPQKHSPSFRTVLMSSFLRVP